MDEQMIYVAVVDGKVSHIYSDQPLRFRVVAWERDDPMSICISAHAGVSTGKDKLVSELFHVFKKAPHDGALLHEEAVRAAREATAS